MTLLTDKRILVVGAAGAFGGLITSSLAAEGASVLASARSNESAALISASAAIRLLLDLEHPTSISTLTDYLNADESPLDGIVLASGLVGFAPVSQTDSVAASRLMQVNHLGPSQLLAALLPKLRQSAEAQREPFILSIPGVVAEKDFSGMSAYSASKAAHSKFLATLALELRRDKIRVINARPGHTETGLATRAIFGTAPAMPPGMDPARVVARLLAAIVGDETDLPSEVF